MNKSKLNICVLTHDFPPQPGGMANHVYEIHKRMVDEGHSVFVVKQKISSEEPHYQNVKGMHVYSIPEIKFKHGRDPLSLLRILLKVRKIVKKHSIDIVHNHAFLYETFLTKFIGNVPVVLTNHESGFLEIVSRKFLHKLIKFNIQHVNFIIAPSEELVNIPIKIGYPHKKTKFIPNGVDEKRFHPELDKNFIRRRLNIRKNDFVVICARRLEPKNGVEYLVKSAPLIMKNNKKIKFVIVGGGFPEERKKFDKMVDSYGLQNNVIFTGNVDYQLMPYYYASADVAILPSVMEATSLAGIEAMAVGLPLIGTNVGGIPYLVENNKTGVLIPPKKPQEIANAISYLYNNKTLCKSFGKAARKKVEENLAWDTISGEVLKIYRKLLK